MQLSQLKITPKKIALLNGMDIYEAEDILKHYPFRYDENIRKEVSQWEAGEKIFFEGIIISAAKVLRFGKNKSMTRFKMLVEEEEFECTIFNRPWTNAFPFDKKLTCFGVYQGGNKITLMNTNSLPIQEQEGIQPVYSTVSGLSQNDWKKFVNKAIEALLPVTEDIIPEEYRLKYKLLKRREALYFIHHPISKNALTQALRTLKYEEFLVFQCCMAQRKSEMGQNVGIAKHFEFSEVFELKRALSFDLTDDQQQAIEEILNDLKSTKTMMRLVQGDVGCGKTLVAAFGAYGCVLAHKQAAFLAPTEILAKQHAASLKKLFLDFDVTVELYCSSLKTSEKKRILSDLQAHKIDILVGTHALYQEDVHYHDLGLVIADEQHRFGVEQRRALISKGEKVDFLLMSATPIPRTLATSLYGDLDVSTIAQLPKGRAEVITRYVATTSMKPILKEVLALIDEGNQCYVVCPAIDAEGDASMRSVSEIYAGMKKTLHNYTIGLLHGQMSTEEKDAVMERFLAHEIQILVSTTVIEVGVDVASANIMVIYDAHRFGLSQLHQLRGRVGRGTQKGYCYLLSSSKEEDSIKRLKLLEKTRDGFEIAKEDLLLRGPGDILGKRQSGIPSFILGDCIKDGNVLSIAKQDGKEIVDHLENYPSIKKQLELISKSTKYLD